MYHPEILNPRSASPILIVCDHASNAVPEEMDGLGIEPAELLRHIAWDIGAAEVARGVAKRLGVTAVLSTFSRLVIDPNRPLRHPGLIPEISDHVQIPANQGLSTAEKEQRIATFFMPYHDAIDMQLSRLCHTGQTPVVVSIHSFTPMMDGVLRPWDMGVLWKSDTVTARRAIDWFEKNTDRTVGKNQPYSAEFDPNECMDRHCDPREIPHLLLEIRQDHIDTHHGAAVWVQDLVSMLRDQILLK